MIKRHPMVVVLGAGFAGLKVVQGLRTAPVEIALIDRHNYHLFQPLLYQVATAALSPGDIAYPIRRIFRTQKNVEVALAEVETIDLSKDQFGAGRLRVGFDYLVIAVGATHSYFGHPDWAGDAPGLKTIDDATEIRKRVLLAFEEAEHEADPASQRAKLTFVIVGGGPTGVEMAGALREIAAKYIPNDFRRIDTTTARIILIQGNERLLPSFAPELSERALKDLTAMGVEVRLNARVTKVEPDRVWIGDESVEAANTFWAAGVQAPKLLDTLGVQQTRSGTVVVGKDLSIPGHPNVFVVGDAAHVIDPKTNQAVPGLAPAAMQMGAFVAKIILNETTGKSTPAQRPEFHYHDKGTMATIGVRRAVADIKGFKFGGLIAWVLWSVVHLSFLISFRNKIFVMLGWINAYLFRHRDVRLITGKVRLDIRKIRTPDGREIDVEPQKPVEVIQS
jgi:NADH dehydrogenase